MKFKFLFVLLMFGVFPLFAQIRNGQNLVLTSWTKNGAESEMFEKISGAVVQTNDKEIKYTMRVKDGSTIVIDFNRVNKRLHLKNDGKLVLSVLGSFSESGSNSVFSFTEEDGTENVLKFRRK